MKLQRPLAFATGILCCVSLLAFAGRWSWLCELLVNFRTHFALLLALLGGLAVVARRWRIAVTAALGFALNLWPMLGAFGNPPQPAPGTRAVRVVELNVYVQNHDLAGVAAYLDSLAADVIVLEEVTTSSAQRLAKLLPRFRHQHLVVDEGVRGVLVLSRWPLVAPRPVRSEGSMFGARADVDLGEVQLRIYGLHLDWPVLPRPARVRNAELAALGPELAACRGACVAVGDFNTTPWSTHFARLLAESGFQDCAAGRGLLPTWPSWLPAALRIRIDQCLANRAVSVAAVRVGAGAGSDHLATINDLIVGAARLPDENAGQRPASSTDAGSVRPSGP